MLRVSRAMFYATVIAIHIANFVYTRKCLIEGQIKEDMNDHNHRLLTTFLTFQERYFCSWNMILQTIYFSLTLSNDIIILVMRRFSSSDYRQPNVNILIGNCFASAVWPCTTAGYIVFWSLFELDRSLVYPEVFDTYIPWLSRTLTHTFPVIVMLIETMYRPMFEPQNHTANYYNLGRYLFIYLCSLFYVSRVHSSWLYPIFQKTRRTLLLPLVQICIVLTFYLTYHMQWPLVRYLNNARILVDS